MSPPLILFILRIGSAALLLCFLGLIAWFLYQDLRAARLASTSPTVRLGSLRVLSDTSGASENDTHYTLSPVTSIGRDSRNTIVLRDAFVSAAHALLTWRDSQWWLEDLGSRNGTLLNDVPLSGAAVVSAGDVFTIGGVRFKLELPGRREMEEGESGIRDSNP